MPKPNEPTPPRNKRALPTTPKVRVYGYLMPEMSKRLEAYRLPKGLSISALLAVVIPLGMDALERKHEPQK